MHFSIATIKHFFALQLSSTKSVDGQATLVHFLEDIIETKYPEISGFENELTHVEQAARGKSTPPHVYNFRRSKKTMISFEKNMFSAFPFVKLIAITTSVKRALI